MLAEITTEILLLLFFVAIIAGFIDAIAGGGGLITIPALLMAQIPPISSLATNKLQASFGTLSAALTMIKMGKVKWTDLRTSLLPCFSGAVLGTFTLYYSPVEYLNIAIPVVMSLVCIYFLLPKKNIDQNRRPIISGGSWRKFFIPSLGFYDGYLGAGAGMFYTLAGVSLRGKSILEATANAKVLNFVSNFASLFIFVLGGKVVWLVGGCMILGQVIGGYLGAKAAISKGNALIRPIIVIMCMSMLYKFVSTL